MIRVPGDQQFGADGRADSRAALISLIECREMARQQVVPWVRGCGLSCLLQGLIDKLYKLMSKWCRPTCPAAV